MASCTTTLCTTFRNHKPLSKKAAYPRMPRLPGTLKERQLTERSLNPSHPCRLAACSRKNHEVARLEFPCAPFIAASRLTASSFLLGTFPSDAPSSNNTTAVFGCPPRFKSSGIAQSADGPYSPHGSYASPQGRGIHAHRLL